MSAFRTELAAASAHHRKSRARRWLFVSYDQLSDEIGPLSREDPHTLGILLVECPAKAARRPYHKQKLALVLTSLRHFAVEQARRGVQVEHVVAESYAGAVRSFAQQTGPLQMMRAAERELRTELANVIAEGLLEEIPHEGWLTTARDFADARAKPPWRMDVFYKHARRKLGILMEAGRPIGGRFSYDTENRKPWRGEPSAPAIPHFEPDAITLEVCDLVRERMGDHPGALDPTTLPASKHDVEAAWVWAKQHCLPNFGPFEDAMSAASRSLFHTRISALVNLLRLPASRAVRDVVAMRSLSLPSKEGFIRQVLGWREFVHHVHEATDGFRTIAGKQQPVARRKDGGDGGSLASFLGAENALPPAYWGTRSGLNCLDSVVEAVWAEGYSHHITRLMVLSNIAMLLEVSPRELTDWFWVAYIDAYDWVVEPNVHGMGTFGLADLMTTKPYVAGSGYIHKMSDYCDDCAFAPKTTCPLTPLYWAYLGRHRDALAPIQRMRLPLAAEAARPAARRRADAKQFSTVRETLARGDALAPGKR